jgi:hypothetical protein
MHWEPLAARSAALGGLARARENQRLGQLRRFLFDGRVVLAQGGDRFRRRHRHHALPRGQRLSGDTLDSLRQFVAG